MCKYDLKDTSWNKLFIVIVSSRNQLQFSNVYCLTDFKIIWLIIKIKGLKSLDHGSASLTWVVNILESVENGKLWLIS